MAKGMTKSEIMSALAEKTGHSRKDIVLVVEELATLACRETKKSGEFSVPGLGKLV
ncbi:MAG: Histone family protein DNA-binding protein, partial [Parcubacteria group bacterium GW2011_GWA2_44_15]